MGVVKVNARRTFSGLIGNEIVYFLAFQMFKDAIAAAVKYKKSGEVDFVDEIMNELEVR